MENHCQPTSRSGWQRFLICLYIGIVVQPHGWWPNCIEDLSHNHGDFGTSMRTFCWRYTNTLQDKNHSNLPLWVSLDGGFPARKTALFPFHLLAEFNLGSPKPVKRATKRPWWVGWECGWNDYDNKPVLSSLRVSMGQPFFQCIQSPPTLPASSSHLPSLPHLSGANTQDVAADWWFWRFFGIHHPEMMWANPPM